MSLRPGNVVVVAMVGVSTVALLDASGALERPATSPGDVPAVATPALQGGSPVQRLPGGLAGPEGLGDDGAGGVLATSIDISTQGRGSAWLTRLPAGGGRARTSAIVAPPTGTARVSTAIETAASPAGAVAATTRRARGPASRDVVTVTTVRPDGHPVSEGRVPGLPRGAYPFAIGMGPTGAVALIAVSPPRGGRAERAFLSFRPAAAAAFGAPVPLSGLGLPSADGTLNSDLPGSIPQVVMAPDGGAAIVDGLAASVRRVTKDGAVGEAAAIAPSDASSTTATFRDDGTLLAASTSLVERSTTGASDRSYASRIVVAEWRPGEPEPTTRALPLRPGEADGASDFFLAAAPGGRTLLALWGDDRHLAVLAGTGTAIEPMPNVAAPWAYEARLLPRADGGTTLLWAREPAPDAGRHAPPSALMAAVAPAGGPFGPPRTIRTSSRGMQLDGAVALGDGRVAIAFDTTGDDVGVFVARP